MNDFTDLRTAFEAGKTIQGYTVEGDDGTAPLSEVEGRGFWRDLSTDHAPAFTCHPTRYRVKPEEGGWHWSTATGDYSLRVFAGESVPLVVVKPDGMVEINGPALRRYTDSQLTWQDRLRNELAELEGRIDKLHAFIGDASDPTPSFQALPEEDRVLLLRQYEVMGDLHTVLCARVGRL